MNYEPSTLMKKYLKNIGLALITLLMGAVAFAQNEAPQMADTMRSNGKIYVVVTVCLLILVGLFLYVSRVDRKVSKLEKELRK